MPTTVVAFNGFDQVVVSVDCHVARLLIKWMDVKAKPFKDDQWPIKHFSFLIESLSNGIEVSILFQRFSS